MRDSILIEHGDELNVREAKNTALNPQDCKLDMNIEHIGSEILSRQIETGWKPGQSSLQSRRNESTSKTHEVS